MTQCHSLWVYCRLRLYLVLIHCAATATTGWRRRAISYNLVEFRYCAILIGKILRFGVSVRILYAERDQKTAEVDQFIGHQIKIWIYPVTSLCRLRRASLGEFLSAQSCWSSHTKTATKPTILHDALNGYTWNAMVSFLLSRRFIRNLFCSQTIIGKNDDSMCVTRDVC